MGRKSSTKQRGASPTPPAPPAGRSGLTIGVVLVVLAVAGAIVLMRGRGTGDSTTAASDQNPAQKTSITDVHPSAEAEAAALAAAKLGPHKQNNLPPIPFQGYAPPRPPAVVTAAFEFAAEHPEILSYVPCFCG